MSECLCCSGDGIIEVCEYDEYQRPVEIYPVLCPDCKGENGKRRCVVLPCKFIDNICKYCNKHHCEVYICDFEQVTEYVQECIYCGRQRYRTEDEELLDFPF